ncbi:hypothetical protein B0H14DRAFT_2567661 [Mycena olivaceomarginata]|nr:hypothetical protein B0H14DRAFT_2567661 [Mycena olivaceomarginata]
MSQTEAKLLPPNLQDTQEREEESETKMASSVLVEVLAIRWTKKASKTKSVATQTSPPRRNRINTKLHDVGVQTDQFVCDMCMQHSAGAGYGRIKSSDQNKRTFEDPVLGLSPHLCNSMLSNTALELEDIHDAPPASEVKDEFESRSRLQYHQKNNEITILGSQPTMRDAVSSAGEVQLKRPAGGIDSPKCDDDHGTEIETHMHTATGLELPAVVKRNRRPLDDAQGLTNAKRFKCGICRHKSDDCVRMPYCKRRTRRRGNLPPSVSSSMREYEDRTFDFRAAGKKGSQDLQDHPGLSSALVDDFVIGGHQESDGDGERLAGTERYRRPMDGVADAEGPQKDQTVSKVSQPRSNRKRTGGVKDHHHEGGRDEEMQSPSKHQSEDPRVSTIRNGACPERQTPQQGFFPPPDQYCYIGTKRKRPKTDVEIGQPGIKRSKCGPKWNLTRERQRKRGPQRCSAVFKDSPDNPLDFKVFTFHFTFSIDRGFWGRVIAGPSERSLDVVSDHDRCDEEMSSGPGIPKCTSPGGQKIQEGFFPTQDQDSPGLVAFQEAMSSLQTAHGMTDWDETSAFVPLKRPREEVDDVERMLCLQLQLPGGKLTRQWAIELPPAKRVKYPGEADGAKGLIPAKDVKCLRKEKSQLVLQYPDELSECWWTEVAEWSIGDEARKVCGKWKNSSGAEDREKLSTDAACLTWNENVVHRGDSNLIEQAIQQTVNGDAAGAVDRGNARLRPPDDRREFPDRQDSSKPFSEAMRSPAPDRVIR